MGASESCKDRTKYPTPSGAKGVGKCCENFCNEYTGNAKCCADVNEEESLCPYRYDPVDGDFDCPEGAPAGREKDIKC